MTHTVCITGSFREIIKWLTTNISPLTGGQGIRKFSGTDWQLVVVKPPVDFFHTTGYVEAYRISLFDSELLTQLRLTFMTVDI